ncbi:hypothetical protein [Paracraurococcus lichenis]|uniref:Uncharacterized protein n=1 Tax=Paracraurococcus lichenis TaxID=3064888 RepID=A0ABT9ECF4_9PROT|nr:hypothetical protein [Paracraurococcus sp. LOR1-02]MDO9713817.1 hypothetical protein [Paracraurococcus sp. LOR1-02]
MTNAWKSLALAAALATAGTALPAALSTPTSAQSNPTIASIPEPMAETIHAKITALNPQTRKITLQGASGRTATVTAGPMVRLEMLRVGDMVDAQFYRSVAFELSKTMNVSPNAALIAVDQNATAPGGMAVAMMRISATVVGIHPSSNSLDVVSPGGGGVYTVHVTDPARTAMLSQIKIGDTITALVSDAIAVSVEKAKSSWF